MHIGYILYIRLIIISLFMALSLLNINECLPMHFLFLHACSHYRYKNNCLEFGMHLFDLFAQCMSHKNCLLLMNFQFYFPLQVFTATNDL